MDQCRKEIRPVEDHAYFELYWIHISDCEGDHE
jgi:hypothetical protein